MRKAFSLVELSIVLVILGLLTGGILAGQSLIRAAELRGVGTEYSRWVTATQSFRDKYFQLPGDMTNATSFWGALSGVSDAACQAISATGAPTCNGNGNGQVSTYTATTYDESMRYWQHLANAGLIEGQYTGLYNGGYVPGTNAPRSKLGNDSCWFTFYLGQYAGSTTQFAGNWGNYFGTHCGGTKFATEEAWNIDTKLDDGKPSQGKIYGYKGTAGSTCTDRYDQAVGAADANAVYSLSTSGKICSMYFVNGY